MQTSANVQPIDAKWPTEVANWWPADGEQPTDGFYLACTAFENANAFTFKKKNHNFHFGNWMSLTSFPCGIC